MQLAAARLTLVVSILASFVLQPPRTLAQEAGALSGSVTDPSGQAVAGATIVAKNTATGQTTDARTRPDGRFSFQALAPGSYAIVVTAAGFAPAASNANVPGTSSEPLQIKLAALPNAPAAQTPAASSEPSLADLGFTTQQTQSNPQLQARLARRTEMLKIHQRLGIITTIPMAAAVITGPMAKAKGKNGQTVKEPTQANLDTHIALGGATTALYLSTAYFAIAAPRIPGTEKHGAIRWHEALAWIHGPGMILTPALGIMAYKQENAGEKVHGIASAHGAVAYVTAASYGAAIVAVSWPIHLKFWEKQK